MIYYILRLSCIYTDYYYTSINFVAVVLLYILFAIYQPYSCYFSIYYYIHVIIFSIYCIHVITFIIVAFRIITYIYYFLQYISYSFYPIFNLFNSNNCISYKNCRTPCQIIYINIII